jgi:formylglycine-generating enzyme required for sulfatase activity
MQRIDENTYIDDTLVTCAEYQLFIDEMRERAKYYQPDHWSSYQFPKGEAQAPIVGVRFSDAKTFCEWLTQREGGEWSFRPPAIGEAEKYKLTNPLHSPLGYWVAGTNGEEIGRAHV